MNKLATHLLQLARVFTTLFATWNYRILAIASGAIFFILPLLIPVWIVPSNTLAFELSLMRPANYLLLSLLAIASGLLVAMNIFLLRQRRERALAVGSGGMGIVSALVGGVVMTSCGCGGGLIIGLLGLGAGSTSFIVGNQLYIILAALLITLVGLYLSARKVAGICQTCEVAAPGM
ncbi:hypothetical protein HKL94_00510 [Candidatus Parcubacteria bacterium]|nr:hypothetical protein [Candidatus Parcubacteria bacterium]